RVELLLAPERERVVFNGQVDLILFHVGQLGFQHELVLAIAVNVDGRHPRAAREIFLRTAVEALEHSAQPLLMRGHVTRRIPTNDSHDDSPLLILPCRAQTVVCAAILWKVELDTSYVRT